MSQVTTPSKTIRLRFDFGSNKWRSQSISHKKADGISKCGKYAIYTLAMVPDWLNRDEIARSLYWAVPPTDNFFLLYESRYQWAREEFKMPICLTVKELELVEIVNDPILPPLPTNHPHTQPLRSQPPTEARTATKLLCHLPAV